MKPALLDPSQAAEFLQTSVRSLERQTAAGKVPGFRKLFGTQARWSTAVLDAWVLSGCPDNAAEFEQIFRQGPPPSAKSNIAIDGTLSVGTISTCTHEGTI